MRRLLHTAPIALLWVAACGPAPDRADVPSVVFVCMDTVRPDHLGCYGYERDTTPTLDALAERSIVFRDASATACWTKPSVPSYLTGTFPIQHGVYLGSSRDAHGASSDVLPGAAWTMAEAFSEAGYQTAAFVKNAQLRKGLGFEQGFDLYRDEAGDARELTDRARAWLEERNENLPFFLYLHYLDAHWPYQIPDEAAHRWASEEGVALIRDGDWKALRDAVNAGEVELAAEQHDDLLGLYDGAIRFIDDQLGELFAALEAAGLAESTVVCVLSDHGEEFLEHGRIGHGHGLYEGLLRVPWLLHVPGRPAAVVEAPTSLTDVFPTVLAAAGLEPDDPSRPPLIGVDRLARPGHRSTIFAEHMGKHQYERSLRVESAKVVLRDHPPGAGPGARQVDIEIEGVYECRLERVDGRWLVDRVEEGDGDGDDPIEIKDVVSDLGPDSLVLAGVTLALGEDVELYGDTVGADGTERALQDGMLVKAKCRVVDGRATTSRIKVYAEGTGASPEVRGPVLALEEERLQVGGLWFPLATDAELPTRSRRTQMSRELALELALELAHREEARAAAWFDLAGDAVELAPRESGDPELVADLLELSRTLGQLRYWGSQDRAALTEGDLEALRAIGYAD